ncbi:hypothetical protein [Streptomyces sp. NBC_00620]|uniref:hypothetical protein n=1 Tax=Streptomyces sp. NBC_00620 TaxID=2903666 RepID=UPI00225BE1FC|nr:hypothetical protein [Streptomyces sp. NBC_00620]MCX4977451.1 hypothetical protein [Streptomyces sp. NBC_00620]
MIIGSIVLPVLGLIVALLPYLFPRDGEKSTEGNKVISPSPNGVTVVPSPIAPSGAASASASSAGLTGTASSPVDAKISPETVEGEIPQPFIGSWRGLLTQGGQHYIVELVINQGDVGDTVAQVEYVDLKCRGTWRLYTSTEDSLTVDEIIEPGDGCLDVSVTVTVEGDGLAYLVDSPTVEGKLERS